MRPGILLVLTMLALVGGPNGSFAQNANVDVGIANTGIQTFHEAVTIGLTPDQVRQMMLDLRQRDSLDAERAAELAREVDQLSTEIGVRKPAVESFLRILGEAQVPVEALNEKLAEIAQRHMDMLERWSVLEEEDDPAIRERTDVAKAAIDAGDYDRADELLAEAEELDLVAARQAQELEVTGPGGGKPALSRCRGQTGQTWRAAPDPVGLSGGGRAFQGGRGAGAGGGDIGAGELPDARGLRPG